MFLSKIQYIQILMEDGDWGQYTVYSFRHALEKKTI